MNKGRHIEYKQFYCKEQNDHLPEVGESGGEEEWGKVGYWAVHYSYTGARSPVIMQYTFQKAKREEFQCFTIKKGYVLGEKDRANLI